MELSEIKNYLRVDFEDDDTLIEGLLSGAEDYIKNTTGKTFPEDSGGVKCKLYVLAVQMLVAHWYANRSVASEKPVNDLPYSLTAIINHLSLSAAYE